MAQPAGTSLEAGRLRGCFSSGKVDRSPCLSCSAVQPCSRAQRVRSPSLFAFFRRGANLAVYLATPSDTAFITKHFTMSYDGVFREGRVYTILTSMFAHGSSSHILVNMLTVRCRR